MLSSMTLGAGGGDAAIAVAVMAIAVLGIGAQWLAWRVRVPSILLLLLAGIIAGPVARSIFGEDTEWSIRPDSIFGDLLMPLVTLSVAIILYEGGLTLTLREIRGTKRVLTLLVSLGAAITWVGAAVAAHYVLELDWSLAILLGAVLIVTGPTVIGPLLGHIRPAGASGPILKWEGIVIDPIGVLCAVLVFEALISTAGEASVIAGQSALAIGKTVLVGGGLGAGGAYLLIFVINRFLVPDHLQNPLSLALVVMMTTVSNLVQTESGLLTATVMGVVLANQRRVSVHHILEFKENLRVLLISALFVVLAARLELSDLRQIDWLRTLLFLLVLIVLVRPLMVAASTFGSGLKWQERVFLSWMAPRGIVAAAGASIFAAGLAAQNVEGASLLVPYTFIVIISTVAFYGLTAPLAARLLGVSDPSPQGIIIVGASPWTRSFAHALQEQDVRVLLVDTNRGNVRASRMEGLSAFCGDVLGDGVIDELDLRGIGRTLALTRNDEVNTLVLQRFERVFGKAEVYTLPSRVQGGKVAKPRRSEADETTGDARGESHTSHGRRLFTSSLDQVTIDRCLERGWVFKSTTLTPDFNWNDYRLLYGPEALVLAVVSGDGAVQFAVAGRQPAARIGDTVIALVNPEELLMPAYAAVLEEEGVEADVFEGGGDALAERSGDTELSHGTGEPAPAQQPPPAYDADDDANPPRRGDDADDARR